MLLVALWFSPEKPTMTTLLGPLIEELNLLYSQGNLFSLLEQLVRH